MAPTADDYDTLNRLLDASALSPSPAEAQGVYCGLLAADADKPEERWLSELLAGVHDSADTATCRDLLRDLATHTRSTVEGAPMGFALLLPGEDRSLRERAIAAHGWCRGFLFGLGLCGVDAAALSPESREAFDDMLELTRMDLDDLADDESNEQALAEIVEFLRVAAMLVYEDRAAREQA
jgi:yecA family protein